MVRDDTHWLSIIDRFTAAALDGIGWQEALTALAAATGSRTAQLCGEVTTGAAEFNFITEFDPAALAEMPDAGAGDPSLNTRLQVGARLPVLQVFADGDFLSKEARRANRFYSDFSVRYDIPFSCQTSVVKANGAWIGLAVIRSRRQGEIGARERALFASIAPHVRAAVQTHLALEQQGALLLAGALERISLAVFICDRLGSVKAFSPSAQALVSTGNPLQLRYGRLTTPLPAEAAALSAAIGSAAGGLVRPGAPLAGSVLVRGQCTTPLLLEVVPLPRRESAFAFQPRALVLVRNAPADPGRTLALLQLLYALSSAEAEVALWLGEGHSPDAIAVQRGTSLGTVRSQIRAIYSKLDIHHLTELVARLNQLR